MSFLRYAVRLLPLLLAASQLPAQKIQVVSPAPVGQQVQFNIYLPLQNVGQLDQLLADLNNPNSSQYQHWLTPQQFRQQFGPSQTDVARITKDLTSRGLTVVGTNSHGLTVQGSVGATQGVLGVPLYNGRRPDGSKALVATQPLKLPASFVQAGAQVAAFAPMVLHQPHAVRIGTVPGNRYSDVGPYWFDDLKQAYDFPSYQSLTGHGRAIGVLMACDFQDDDMAAYFGHEHLAVPHIVRVPLFGGATFDPNSGACLEAALDIQQSGGMAPGATILDYNIPVLSLDYILFAYILIIESNQADIVTSSFGEAEGFFTAAYNGGTDYTAYLTFYDEIFKQGNAQGITFVASSGDSGALGLPSLGYFTATPQHPPVVTAHFVPGIQIPASSPHVTAVGGTNLVTRSSPAIAPASTVGGTSPVPGIAVTNRDSRYVRENADYDRMGPYDPYGVGNLVSGGVWQGGGGVSLVFHKPLYQSGVYTGFNMRTIPDISFHMGGCPYGMLGSCPADRSAVLVAFDYDDVLGYYEVIGTSAGAPAMAGILALEEQLKGRRLGNVNNLLYSLAADQNGGGPRAYHKGIPGDNGWFKSPANSLDYNLVIGNGTPFVRGLIGASSLPAAGLPQTPSNP